MAPPTTTEPRRSETLPQEVGPRIEITNLGVEFATKAGPLRVLDDLGLSVKPGELLSIVGPSGCGKSTLLNCVAGLLAPTEGKTLFDDAPLDLARNNVAMCFQEPSLLPWRTAMGNIMLGLESHKRRDRPADRDRAIEAAQRVGLEHFLDSYPKQLSGGMRMRAVLARAIAMRAPVLLLDEPFAALDSFTRESMQELVLELYGQNSFTGILITHSIEEAIYMGGRVLVMGARPSRILADLPVDEPYPRPYAARTTDKAAKLRAQIHKLLSDTQSSEPAPGNDLSVGVG